MFFKTEAKAAAVGDGMLSPSAIGLKACKGEIHLKPY